MNLLRSVRAIAERRDVLLVSSWVALVLVVMSPYLFWGRVIAPGADAIGYYYPAMYWYAETLRRGDSMLWDPQIFSGFPSYLSQVSGYLEPLNVALFSFIPFVEAYHLRLIIGYLLVMIASYLAARKWGISPIASFFVGPTYLMSFHWWYLSNTVITNSLFLLPFIFWVYISAAESASFSRRSLWGILGGVGVGWAFLSGYAQFVVYVLTFVGIYAVADFFLIRERALRTLRHACSLAFMLLMFAAIGFLVGSPQILAALAHAPVSVRAGGLSYSLTQLKVLEPQELIYFLFPDYLRFPLITGGKKTLFIGVFSLLCALLALGSLYKNRFVAIVTGLFLFALVMSVPSSPLYYLFHQLPVFDLFRFPYRWMYLGVFMLSILGAIGFDTMRRDVVITSYSRTIAYGALALAAGIGLWVTACTFLGEWFWHPIKLLAFTAFAELIYVPAAFPKELIHYQGALERGIDAMRAVTNLQNLQFAIPCLSLWISVVVFALRLFGNMTSRAFEWAAAVIITSTFVGVFVARWPDSLPSSVFDEHRRVAQHVIPAESNEWRAHPFNLGDSFMKRVPPTLAWNTENVLAGVEMQIATAAPNDHRFAGISLTDGYDPFVSKDLVTVLGLLGGNYGSEAEVQGVSLEDRVVRLTSHLDVVGMMSGKYIISGVELSHPDLTLIATPQASRYDVPFFIYENKRALPRVRVARDVADASGTSLTEHVTNGSDFSRLTYLDCESCAVRGGEGVLTIEGAGNGHFNILTKSTEDIWVVVGEYFLPGWKAAVDGREVPIIRANAMYMAIRVGAGEHRLVVQYEGVRGEARWLRWLGLYPYPELSKEAKID